MQKPDSEDIGPFTQVTADLRRHVATSQAQRQGRRSAFRILLARVRDPELPLPSRAGSLVGFVFLAVAWSFIIATAVWFMLYSWVTLFQMAVPA